MADFMFIDAFQAFLQELSPQEKLQVGKMLQTQLEVEVKRSEEALMSRRRVLHHLQCSICQGLWDTLFAGREAPWHGDEPTDSEWVADGDARVAVNIYALKKAHRTATNNWQWAAMMINNNKIVPPPPGSEAATAAAAEQTSKGKGAERLQVQDQGSLFAVPLAIQQRVDAANTEAAVPGQKGPGAAKAKAAADVLRDRKGKAAERPMAENQGSSRANLPKSFGHPTPELEESTGNQKAQAQGGYRQRQIWSDGDVTIPPPASVRESDTSQHPHALLVREAGGAARSTIIAAANTNLGPWQDEHGRDLPRFAGAGPGEIILPPNIDPLTHIVPVRAKVEELLNVALWYVSRMSRNPFVKHNKIGVKPTRGSMSEEGQSSYCRRAFLVLTRWALQVGETGAVIPLLDFVKADVRDEIGRVTGMISALLTPAPEEPISTRNPKPLMLSSQTTTKRVAEAPRDVTVLPRQEGATSERLQPASGPTPASTLAVGSAPYPTPNKRRREGSDAEDEPLLDNDDEADALRAWRGYFAHVQSVFQKTIPDVRCEGSPDQNVFCLLLRCLSAGWHSPQNLEVLLGTTAYSRKWICVVSVCRENQRREVARDGTCAHCKREGSPHCVQIQNVRPKKTIVRLVSFR